MSYVEEYQYQGEAIAAIKWRILTNQEHVWKYWALSYNRLEAFTSGTLIQASYLVVALIINLLEPFEEMDHAQEPKYSGALSNVRFRISTVLKTNCFINVPLEKRGNFGRLDLWWLGIVCLELL